MNLFQISQSIFQQNPPFYLKEEKSSLNKMPLIIDSLGCIHNVSLLNHVIIDKFIQQLTPRL